MSTSSAEPFTTDEIEAVLHDVLPLTTARLGDEDIAEIAFNLHAALAEPTPEPTDARAEAARRWHSTVTGRIRQIDFVAGAEWAWDHLAAHDARIRRDEEQS